MSGLETKIGYHFHTSSLLRTALTHSSWSNENRSAGSECNERLEFLGDAVLGFVVADYLYGRFPDLSEGRMTRLRSELVCERSLSGVAAHLGLGENLLLGHGEEHSGGRTRPSVTADAVEAVIAAIFLDGGLEPASTFIHKFILDGFEAGETRPDRDCKSELQELVQRRSGQLLEYRPAGESGPDHMKVFTVEVWLNDELVASGQGRSKKDAEQHAAAAALEILQ